MNMLALARLPLLLVALSTLLAACTSAAPMPAASAGYALPRWLHVVQRQAGQPDQDGLLVVQREGETMRWSLFDPLGAPLTRQVLDHGDWRSDGLAPPNTEARMLFAALLFAWTPQTALNAAYTAWREEPLPGGGHRRVLLDGASPLWTVDQPAGPAQSPFIITQSNGIQWIVTPLKEQP